LSDQPMASNKSGNSLLPHSNRPELPTGFSLERSTIDDLSMWKNFKHPVIELSQIGDEIQDQDVTFKPGRNFSNPLNNIDEESEVDLMHYDMLLLLCWVLIFWSVMSLLCFFIFSISFV